MSFIGRKSLTLSIIAVFATVFTIACVSPSPVKAAPNLHLDYWPIFTIPVNQRGTIVPADDDDDPPYVREIPSGKSKWAFALDAKPSSDPTIGPDGTLYVATESKKLYAIAPNGSPKWEVTVAGVVSHLAVGSDGTIHASSTNGTLYALDTLGRTKWTFVREGALTRADNIRTFERFQYKPSVVGNDGTIIGVGADRVYALRPEGNEKWEYATTGEPTRPIVGKDGTIFVGTETGNLHAIKPNGEPKWTLHVGAGSIYNEPLAGEDGTLYVEIFGSTGDTLFAINPNGTVKWSKNYKTFSTPAIDADGTLYVWTNMKLLAVKASAEIKWSVEPIVKYDKNIAYPGGNKPLFPTARFGADGMIYATTNVLHNSLFAIDKLGNLHWKYSAPGIGARNAAVGKDGTVYAASDSSLIALGTAAASIVLDKKTIKLETGVSELLTATVIPDAASDKQVIWSSSDASVAVVDGTGKVTGVSPGPAKIIAATADGGFTALSDVTVLPSSKQPPGAQPPEVTNSPFTDIKNHWAEDYIEKGFALQIVNGYPDFTFRPDDSVTRAEFAVMLMNAVKPDVQAAPLVFKDRETIGKWARQAVSQAVRLGIVLGSSDGNFRPSSNITHAEMIAMVARASGLPVADQAISGFEDDADIPAWAKGAAAAARLAGITDFLPNNRLAPKALSTRAEATAAILNMLDVPPAVR